MEMLQNKRVVDLFAGCGGLSAGFRKAGFHIVEAYENWKYAAECYRYNFPEVNVRENDLSESTVVEQEVSAVNPDIIIGGPPCQDFSSAGKRAEGARAELTVSFAEIVCKNLPKVFVMENVPQARTSMAYMQAKKMFSEEGYTLEEHVLDASLHGVPQKRKRLFLIGILDNGGKNYHLTVRESIIPLSVRDKYPNFAVEYYYRHPRSYSRRGIFSIDEPSPTVRGVVRQKPTAYIFHKKDPSNDNDIRALSFSERALIQTFPLDYKWPKAPKTVLDQMLGNAVPVELAKTLAESIEICFIKEQKYISFTDWLIDAKQLSFESAKDIISHIRKANCINSVPTDIQVSFEEYLEQIVNLDKQYHSKHATISINKIRRAFNYWIEYLTLSEEIRATSLYWKEDDDD